MTGIKIDGLTVININRRIGNIDRRSTNINRKSANIKRRASISTGERQHRPESVNINRRIGIIDRRSANINRRSANINRSAPTSTGARGIYSFKQCERLMEMFHKPFVIPVEKQDLR
ncbi:hypothetical protein ACFQ4A_17275 [Lentibacillus salinarum]|uniref:Uncharacterized protein n=1 Tax=Lentibacillus salinarum TaxID=446820 RepID=A0ABW4A012_9BACI